MRGSQDTVVHAAWRFRRRAETTIETTETGVAYPEGVRARAEVALRCPPQDRSARGRAGRAGCCAVPPVEAADPRTLRAAATAIGEHVARTSATSATSRPPAAAPAARLLFLETLARLGAAGPRAERARRTLRSRWADTDPGATPGTAAYGGVAGDLYATLLLATYDDDPRLRRRLARGVELLAGTHDDGLDLVGGAAGVVLVLTRVAERYAPLRTAALDAAAPRVERLLAAARPYAVGAAWPTLDAIPLLGFAHGSSGIAYVLAEYAAGPVPAGRRARVERAVAAAAAYERHLFEPRVASWPDLRPVYGAGRTGYAPGWCHGAAGIGLARAAALRRTASAGDHAGRRELAADLALAVGAARRGGLGSGQGLCHGDLGLAETLLSGAAALGEAPWAGEARRIGAMVAAAVVAAGGRTTPGAGTGHDAERDDLVGGAAGVGYELLRLTEPAEVPSVLQLAVPAGRHVDG